MKKTKNYGMFTMVDTNREVSRGFVKRLKSSILEKNMLSFNPIIVDKNMVVIDGQHRLEAAKQLGVDIYYNVADFVGIREIRRLNTAQNSWTLLDFVQSYAKTSEDYQYLLDFAEANQLPTLVAAQILTNFKGSNGKTKNIKQGEFKLGDLKQVEKFMEAVSKLEPFLSEITRRDRGLNVSINILDKKKVNWTTMQSKANTIAQYKEDREIITKQVNQVNYLRMFEDIYNHNSKKPVRLF